MPYAVRKSGSGYKVYNKITGKTYSKKPIPKERAEAQMRAMYMHSGAEAKCESAFSQALNFILDGI